MKALCPLKWWSTPTSAVFGLSSTLLHLVEKISSMLRRPHPCWGDLILVKETSSLLRRPHLVVGVVCEKGGFVVSKFWKQPVHRLVISLPVSLSKPSSRDLDPYYGGTNPVNDSSISEKDSLYSGPRFSLVYFGRFLFVLANISSIPKDPLFSSVVYYRPISITLVLHKPSIMCLCVCCRFILGMCGTHACLKPLSSLTRKLLAYSVLASIICMYIRHNNMQGNNNRSKQQLLTTDQQRYLGIIDKYLKWQKQT